MMKKNRYFAVLAASLVALQFLLIVASWLITAAYPEFEIRPLLGEEGVRWFVGMFSDNLASVFLVWMLLVSVALGAIRHSGLYEALRKGGRLGFRDRFAMKIVMAELCLLVVVMLLLTSVPHAILLNATGRLFPGSFASGILPVATFSLTVFSVTYGLASGRLRSIDDVFSILARGVAMSAPLFVLYILFAELYFSLRFVFMM